MPAHKPFTLIAALIFLLMAIMHIYRSATGLPLTIGGFDVPRAASVAGVVIAGLLAVMLFKESRR